MKVKTSELTCAALDWAVAKCEFPEPDYQPQDWLVYITEGCMDDGWAFKPSTDWEQGGPIIEREKIAIDWDNDFWNASTDSHPAYYSAETPLIAAMRVYVASMMGEEVEVPHELA